MKLFSVHLRILTNPNINQKYSSQNNKYKHLQALQHLLFFFSFWRLFGQVNHYFLEICQQRLQLSLVVHCFISTLRALESWHSLRNTHIHLTVTALLGTEAILYLLDVCKALENPMSFGRGLRHVPQHSILPWNFSLLFDSMLLNLYHFQPFHRIIFY